MSDRQDDEKDQGPEANETQIRGREAPASDTKASESNDDATILRPKDKTAASSSGRDADQTPGRSDGATQHHGPEATPNDDSTVIRGDVGELIAEGSDDATLLRPSDRKPGNGEADATVVREEGKRVEAPKLSATPKPQSGKSADSGGAAATILRSPSETGGEATILRISDIDNATILREPGEDGAATILRASDIDPEDRDGDGATTIRAPDDGDDEDRTIMNENFDDDSTVLGAGSDGQDTTYIASVGKQARPQGNSEAGRLLKNRFVLEEKIGSGGMGDVYKALDLRQQEAQERDPYIAVKLLNENFSRHKDAFLSLQRETSRTRSIPHPNIMGVYDFDREGDTVFMSMELLDGKPLDDYLKEHPEGVSQEDAWNILDGICAGLNRAHNAGIVHSDFKPGNIFYTKEKVAKVFDFGIARAISNPGEIEADGEKTVFDAGSLGALTPTYASYEMLKGLEPSKSDDVYAVALVAYELFMGKHPYDRVPADKAFERGLKPKPIPFLKRRHWKVLKKALELKGEDRTQSIDEFTEGMFSKDPPYFTYAAVGTVLLASIGFGTYQTLNVKELPKELAEFQDAVAAAESTARSITTPRWDSPVWHEQLADAMNRWRLAEQNMLDNEEWVEEWELEPDPAIAATTKTILKTYLLKIVGVREDAQTYDSRRQEEFGVTQALEELTEAKSYMDRVVQHYRLADPDSVAQELQRLDRRIGIRTNQLQEIELAEAEAEAARIAEEERQIAEAARIKFENDRTDQFTLYLKDLTSILRCKGDVGDSEVERFGELLGLMRSEWPEAYEYHYPKVVSYIATCIQQRIGFVDPERARKVQTMVASFIPGESQISSLVIEDKDPCDERKLIGRGNRNRSWCVDRLSEGGEGPELVVIPEITVKDHKYAISRAEIKVGEYNVFCEKTGCVQLTGVGSSLPATNLTIDQARQYANWLTSQTGQRYRLPTVREWEFAAIAENSEKLVDENINCTVDSRGVRLGEKLLNVISGKSNDYGLYNYVGNAREWALEEDTVLALGGAHTDPRQECTLDKRIVHAGNADSVTGFRLVREIEEKDKNSKKADLAASG